MTGLAQLVAEELEGYWSNGANEYHAPGQTAARKRGWSDMSTADSRSIRMSHKYVRKNGATTRMMLIHAAANEWNVPAFECTTVNSMFMHVSAGGKTTFGKIVKAAAKLQRPAEVKLMDSED